MSDMTIARDVSSHRSHRDAVIGVSAVLAVSVIALAVALPAPLVLPALSILLVAVGFATAAGLYLAGRRIERDRTRGWEFAALLVFLGFAAAMLTNNGEALAVLDQAWPGTMTAASK